MVEVIFDYNQIKTEIKADLEDSFNTIVNKFINEAHLDKDVIYSLPNGKKINRTEKVKDLINESKKIIKN